MRFLDSRVREVEALAFSPDARFLTVGGKSRFLEVWNASSGEHVQRLRVNGPVSHLHFHPHRPVAFAVLGPSACVLSHAGGKLSVLREFRPYSDRLQLSADGRRLVVSGRFDLSVNGQRLETFETDGDELVNRLWGDPLEGDGNLHWGLVWVPGTDQLVVSEWVGDYPAQKAQLTLRDGATGGIINTYPRHGLPAEMLAASPAGTLIAVSRATLSAWPGADLSCAPRVIRNDNRNHFTGVAFHPSGRYLAATSRDMTVKLYDTASWEVARVFTWDIGRVRSIAFSPDGTLAAAGSDTGKVVVWDVDG
jgi:WD40 repeat protein